MTDIAREIATMAGGEPERTSEHVATVVRVDPDGTPWVHVAGGAEETPCARTFAEVKPNDTVTVAIANGRATITGNLSSPAVGQTAVVQAVEPVQRQVAQVSEVVAEKADIVELNALTAHVGELEADTAKVHSLTAEQLAAATAYIAALTAENVTAASLVADVGKVHSLTAQELSAAAAYIAALDAGSVTAQDIIADHGDFGTVKANAAKVASLTAEQLSAATAYIAALSAGNVTAQQVIADHATVGSMDANYAQVNLANVNNAWIANGVIKDAAISNEMVGSLSANKLTAGTINGSVINVTNLNADNITAGTVNGQRIGQGSLSLDKLSEAVYTEGEVDSMLETMQAEIDGAIETWTGTVVPTLNNAPASGWTTTAERDKHVGDVYFVVNSQSQQDGYNYRFTKSGSTYSWQLIKDSDVTAALQRLETAEGKIEVFDEDISDIKTDTGSLKTRATNLETRMTTAEGDISTKVSTTTFNELSSTVDGNTQTITKLTETVQRGGRNLLRNTADPSSSDLVLTRSALVDDGIVRITPTSSSEYLKWRVNYLNYADYADDTYTFSFDARAADVASEYTTEANVNAYIAVNLASRIGNTISSSYDRYSSPIAFTGLTSNWKRFSITKQVPADLTAGQASALVAGSFLTVQVAGSASHKPVEVRRLKLERGPYATPWEYSQDDVTSVSNKVNTVSDTVDGHTQTISSMGETITTKADGSTVTELSSTVNNISDTVDGHTSNLNSLTQRVNTVANPNLASYWSAARGDTSFWVNENVGYVSSELGEVVTQLTDGWAHVDMDNSAGTKTAYVNCWAVLNGNLKTGTQHTFLMEVRNLVLTAGVGFYFRPATDNETSTRYDQFAGGTITSPLIAENGTWRISATTLDDYTPCTRMSDGYLYVAVGTNVSFDIRVSLYEGDYTGPFKPYVPVTEVTTLKQDYATYKQTTTESLSSIGTRITTAEGKITSAETAIQQNASDITLRATKTEAYQTAQPNLSPMFGVPPYWPAENPYWVNRENTTVGLFNFTHMGDGWVRVQCDMTSQTSSKRCNMVNMPSPSVEPDKDYTFLFEFRNNNSTFGESGTANVYVVQTNGDQFWGGAVKKIIENGGTGPNSTTYIKDIPSNGTVMVKRFVKVSEAADGTHWGNYSADNPFGCVSIVPFLYPGDNIDFEMRMSIYEGEYTGPYKPYAGPQLYATQAELKVTADGISSEVSKKTDSATIISTIRQSAESVKIKASQVEIDGAAIFSDSTFKSKLDGAYDAKGAAATAKSEAIASAAAAQRAWYAECSTDAATVAKVATVSPATTAFTLTKGQRVAVFFSATNTGAVGSLTLNVNGTGAKNIKYLSNGAIANLPAVGYLRASGVVDFVYDGTYWVTDLSYNSDTYTRTRYQINLTAAEAITSGRVICGTASGYRDIAAGVAFDLAYPLLYASTAIAKGATTGTLNNNYLNINGITLTNNGTITSGAAAKVCYLKGTVSANTFTIAAIPFMTTVAPTSEDGYFYIPLGVMSSASACYFESSKNLYAYLDGKFRQVTPTDVIASQRIYYRSSANTKPNGNGLPTAWVTETGDKYAANATTASNWSKKVTPIANGTGASVTKYLYLWTCEQRKRLDGTVSYTDILLDSSTTVIDGGNIITGSVTANQLNASSINASKMLTVGSMSADAQASILNENIQIGGRNYAKTNAAIGYYQTSNGVTATVADYSTVTFNGTSTALTVHFSSVTYAFGGLKLSPGEYQLWLTNTMGGNIWFRLGKGTSNAHVYSTKGDYSKTSPYKFTVTEEDVYWFYPVIANGVTYSNVTTSYMLERGNKATDWLPAPEDQAAYTESAINAAGGFDILWNRPQFANDTNAGGEAYICAYDPTTATRSDANGWVMWNGTKRTVAKGMIDPNAVLPYNIPIYIVCRLSSTTSTTGTNYLVWYTSSGWQYAVVPTPTAVGGAWTWNQDTDMVLGKFVEPGSEVAFTECETYRQPLKWGAITTDTVTARSANALATTANTTANAAAPKTSAVAEEQYIYISKASGTASVAANTTWVTASGDTQNAWTTKRPTYNGAYPLLFVAKQKKVVSGTVTCTTPVKDDTTTVIDGGHITTGQIDTARLNVSDIKDSGDFVTGSELDVEADRISSTVGDLDAALSESVDNVESLAARMSAIEQTATQIQASVSNVEGDVTTLRQTDSALEVKIANAAKSATDYLTFANGKLTLGASSNAVKAELSASQLAFVASGSVPASIGVEGGSGVLLIDNARVTDQLKFGDFAWIKRDNGNMTLKWIGA